MPVPNLSASRTRPASRLLGMLLGTVMVAGMIFAAGSPAMADPATGTISGTITADGGGTLPDESQFSFSVYNANDVFASLESGVDYDVAYDSDSGDYSITGLALGSYKISYTSSIANGIQYLGGWYDDGTTFETATSIPLISATPVTADITLARSALIGGTLVVPGGATPPSNFNITVYAADGDGETSVEQANTSYNDVSGSYSISNLPVGTYRLFYDSSAFGSTHYLGGWFGGSDFASAADVVVTTPSPAFVMKNITLVKSAVISGTISVPSGSLPDMSFSVYPAASDNAGSISTSVDYDPATGAFTISGLAAGSYKLQYRPSNDSPYLSGWYNGGTSFSDATEIAITPSAPGTVAITLAKSAVISGTVSVPSGSRPSDMQFSVYKLSRDEVTDASSTYDQSTGAYSIANLSPGTYKVQFRPTTSGGPAYLTGWIGGTTFVSASALTIDTTTPTTRDILLTASAVISGHVTVPAGARPASISFTVWDSSGNSVDDATSDYDSATGAYSVTRMPAGTYEVSYNVISTEAVSYVSGWYGGTDFASATPLVVSLDTPSTVNISLVAGIVISGTVSVPALSTRPSDMDFDVRDVNKPNESLSPSLSYDSSTGHYFIAGLPAATYKVRYYPGDDFVSAWIGGATEASATAMTVGTSSPQPANISLAKAASIQGSVTVPAGGAKAAGIYFTLYNSDQSVLDVYYNQDYDSSAGTYSIKGIPAGSYKVGFSTTSTATASYLGGWVNGTTLANATPVAFTVAGPNSMTVTVTGAGTITGTVTPHAGYSLPTDIGFTVWDAGNSDSPVDASYDYNSTTGVYSISGLPTGSYKISYIQYPFAYAYAMYGASFLTSWVNGGGFVSATPASVTAGTSTPLNFTLDPLTTFITGTISVPTGGVRPSDIDFTVWDSANHEVSGLKPTYDDTSGLYSIAGVTAGTYRIQYAISGGIYSNGWYGGTNLVTATPVVVTAYASDADFTLSVLAGSSATIIPGTVTVGGATIVGSTLTATPGTWAPAPVALTYQWLRNGSTIPDAAGSTYVTAAADVGKAITVRVTGTKSGFTAVSATSGNSITVSAVTPATIVAGTVTIAGSTDVGGSLTASAGTWTPAPVALSYQWLRNGAPIAGATGASYVTVAADGGTAISVTVTGAKSGSTSVSKTSATIAINKAFTPKPKAKISGTAKVGKKLTASAGKTPSGTKLTYKWLANGKAIKRATKSSYKLVKSLAKKTITVTVTVTKTGYTTVVTTSGKTKKVAK